MSLLFLDNGGYNITALYSSGSERRSKENSIETPFSLTCPNCVGISSQGTHHIGASLLSLPHYHELIIKRPIDKGFLVDPPLQATIWLRGIFQPLGLVEEQDVDLVLTIPHGAPADCAEALGALCFEHFHFKSVTFVSSALLALVGGWGASASNYNNNVNNNGKFAEVIPATTEKNQRSHDESKKSTHGGSLNSNDKLSGIVIDCGFSGTIVTPFINGRSIVENIIRIDVGGKVLTNYLKELISFSQVQLTNDTWIANKIKESCCECSLDFLSTLEQYERWSHLTPSQRRQIYAVPVKKYAAPQQIHYVLPSTSQTQPYGFKLEKSQLAAARRQELQYITLRHESYVVTELLFHPVHIGIKQCGVTEAIASALWTRPGTPLFQAPLPLKALLVRNIVVVGGTALGLPHFGERVETDLTSEFTENVQPKVVGLPGLQRRNRNLITRGALDLFFSRNPVLDLPAGVRVRFHKDVLIDIKRAVVALI